jgi:DNA invertase Pin-like site-specific DNA recombinase
MAPCPTHSVIPPVPLRLSTNRENLCNTIETIAKAGAGFRSLHDTWADTTTAHGRLMVTVLGGLAEFERELIRARTGEGRERAKANGVKMGRKPIMTPYQIKEARQRIAKGEKTREVAKVSMSASARFRG